MNKKLFAVVLLFAVLLTVSYLYLHTLTNNVPIDQNIVDKELILELPTPSPEISSNLPTNQKSEQSIKTESSTPIPDNQPAKASETPNQNIPEEIIIKEQATAKLLKDYPELTLMPYDNNLLYQTQIQFDFNGDGKKETLSLNISNDFPSDVATNLPIMIELSIENKKAIYKNEWNDGVSLYIIDIDTTDSIIDICIVSSGTDVSYCSNFYRYDGKNVYEYAKLHHFSYTPYYDKKGKIYFYNPYFDIRDEIYDSEPENYFQGFDYKTKQIFALK